MHVNHDFEGKDLTFELRKMLAKPLETEERWDIRFVEGVGVC